MILICDNSLYEGTSKSTTYLLNRNPNFPVIETQIIFRSENKYVSQSSFLHFLYYQTRHIS